MLAPVIDLLRDQSALLCRLPAAEVSCLHAARAHLLNALRDQILDLLDLFLGLRHLISMFGEKLHLVLHHSVEFLIEFILPRCRSSVSEAGFEPRSDIVQEHETVTTRKRHLGHAEVNQPGFDHVVKVVPALAQRTDTLLAL